MNSRKNSRIIKIIIELVLLSLITLTSFSVNVNAECTDWCDLSFVDTDIDDTTLRVGDRLRIFVKLKMRYDDDNDDSSVKVTVTVENSDEYSKWRIFSFSDSGDRVSKWFEFDTDDWDADTYTVWVKARGECGCDTISKRIGTFRLSEDYYYRYYPYGYDYPYRYVYPKEYYYAEKHCLSVDRIWTDEPLRAGEKVNAYVRVGSCGTTTERDVRVRLTAFSRSYNSNILTISKGGSRDLSFIITVPEDAVGSHSFEATAWNNYKTDTWSKTLDIKASKPTISVKPEYTVEDCKVNRIALIISNEGDIEDTFTLSVTGPAAGWITGVPEKITLNAGQAERINAYVSVPCDIDEDFYQFTIKAQDSSDYTVTSGIRVERPYSWPEFNLPTGYFIGATGIFVWLPWILLFIMLFLFYWMGSQIINERRRPMF
jgi:hypothetical protein